MRSRRSYTAVIAALAAALIAGTSPALASEGNPADRPVAMAPEGAAPAKDAPAPGAKAEDPKAPAPAAKSAPAPAAPAGAGMWASLDDFMKRTGRKLEETRVVGLRMRPYMSEEIAFSDNIFYQDRNEKIVVDDNPDGDATRAFVSDGIDNDNDGRVDEPGESLAAPRGRVSDLVNNFTLGVDFEMPLNANLIPLLGDGETTLKVFGANLQSVQYITEPEGPDAFNWNVRLDLPVLLNAIVRNLTRMEGQSNAVYFRLEGDYSRVTDPLDVAKYQYKSTAPSFNTIGSRDDFTREEWFGKATLGWKGSRFDAKASYRYYAFQVNDSQLDSADHNQQTLYGEVGYRPAASEHRYYGFVEKTVYDWKDRDPGNPAEVLRNYDMWRTGPGWEGPLFSKKVRGTAEVYWIGQDIPNQGPPLPRGPDTLRRDFNEFHGMGGKATAAYRPFTAKATTVQAEYKRELQWSVVAEHKIVDSGSLVLIHPINEKLTAELMYSVTHDNVSHREKRLYQEAGIGLKYKLFAYTEASLRYTFRHMRSNGEPTTRYSDAINEPFLIQPNGDFFANVISLGINVNF